MMTTTVRIVRSRLGEIIVATVFGLLASHQLSPAQDTHYWNIQYGTRSTLLGGAVIGSVSDLSATYYNPGALGLSSAHGLILSTGVYEGHSLTLEGAGVQKRKVSKFGFNVAPSLVAGRFPADSNAADRLAYSLLTRQRANLNLQWRFIGSQQEIQGVQGPGSVSEEAALQQYITETWGGLTWSRSLSQVVGLGVTTFFALRSQEKGGYVTSHALAGSGAVAGLAFQNNYNYYNVRVLWKAGLALDLSSFSLGFTFTTPSLELFGSGAAYVNLQSSGVDANGDGVPEPIFIAANQEELSSNYRSSWAVGFGASYEMDPFRFDISAEWYAPVSRFNVLEPESFAGQSTGAIYRNVLSAAFDPVLNFGVGVEYVSGEHASWYASVITDRSAMKPGSGSNIAFNSIDYVNVTGGGIFSAGKSKITLGLGYAFGSSPISFSDNPILNAATDERYAVASGTKLTSIRLRLIFAFSYAV